MLWIGTVLLLVVLAAVATGYLLSAPRYQGPVSDHFDGKQFKNIGGAQSKGFKEVLSWMMNRKQGEWSENKQIPPGPPPPAVVTSDSLRITFINHTTFLIQTEGLNILTDPVWSERVSPFTFAGPKRMRPPGIRLQDLPRIDVILLSHNHYDHLDVATLKQLVATHQPRFITPLGVKAYLDQKGITPATDMDWGQELPLKGNLQIACVPAQHFSGRGMFDRDATLWCGYVLKHPAGNIYFAGDTGYGPIFRPIGEKYAPIRLAILPIGAYRPQWFMLPIHVSPEQAVQIHRDVKASRSIASHFGTFPLADDGKNEPIQDLQQALKKHNLPESVFVVPKEGEGLVF